MDKMITQEYADEIMSLEVVVKDSFLQNEILHKLDRAVKNESKLQNEGLVLSAYEITVWDEQKWKIIQCIVNNCPEFSIITNDNSDEYKLFISDNTDGYHPKNVCVSYKDYPIHIWLFLTAIGFYALPSHLPTKNGLFYVSNDYFKVIVCSNIYKTIQEVKKRWESMFPKGIFSDEIEVWHVTTLKANDYLEKGFVFQDIDFE